VPDTVVTDQVAESRLSGDVERASGSSPSSSVDPFQIRDGFIPEEELAGLRRRNKGKSVVQFQKLQNNVSVSEPSEPLQIIVLSSSLS
jgi:hypothetical protein